jgi:hypothetical protein
VQGEWQHSRKNQQGNFHAMDYNSLVCGCDGVFDGKLCNPGDRELGPEPRKAPANMICFSGAGRIKQNGAGNEVDVAFRVDIEDRGEPGAGNNAGNLEDVYRIRIWVPTGAETVDQLAASVCCTQPKEALEAPCGPPSHFRCPDVDDGGNLVHGNLQIHPELPNTVRGICPPPDGTCPAQNAVVNGTPASSGAYTRSFGFFTTHVAETQGLIDAAGSLPVCGVSITGTNVNVRSSAMEAMCVSPHGQQDLQLAREMTAAALNLASGTTATFPDFAACNAICADPHAKTVDVVRCTDAAQAFNASGDDLPAPFDVGGPADSTRCDAAFNTRCTIFDAGFCQ